MCSSDLQVLEFLGADPDFELSFGVVNRYKAVKSKRLHDFLLRPPRPAQRLAQALLPKRFRTQIFSRARALNTRPEKRPAMTESLRRGLEAEFAAEIERLEAMLGRDLSLWKPQTG